MSETGPIATGRASGKSGHVRYTAEKRKYIQSISGSLTGHCGLNAPPWT
jgi:hypothetical protein